MRAAFAYAPLVIVLLAAVPAGGPAVAQDLQVKSTSFDGVSSIGRFDPIEITLTRRPTVSDGRVALMIGSTDVTALSETPGSTLRYTPGPFSLPTGEVEIVVFLTGDEGWTELRRLPVVVRRPGDLLDLQLDPALSLNNDGQVLHRQSPEPDTNVPRTTYQDFTGRAGLSGKISHPYWTAQMRADVMGVGRREEALRFGAKGAKAPRIDLASYNVQVRQGPMDIRLGHVSHGRNRHLISSFGSRGATLGFAIGSRTNASVAAVNGSRIVGWSNPFGFNNLSHRILGGTVGVDLLTGNSGTARLDLSLLDGAVLPRNAFNEARIMDAERSRGAGIQLVTATPGERLRLEGGITASRFRNTSDPDVLKNVNFTPLEEDLHYAHYLNVSVGLLRNLSLGSNLPIGLSAAYSRERVDPFYRTVAAYVRSDIVENALSLNGNVGAFSIQLAHSRSGDNLGEVVSILTTKTRRNNISVGAPLSTGIPGVSQRLGRFLPSISYAFDQTHQFGLQVPENGGFNASHIPDQLSTMHSVGANWHAGRSQFGYRFNSSYQDNRQEGREDADFLHTAHSVSFTLRPHSTVDIGIDAGLDQSANRATDRIDFTRRIGFRVGARPFQSLRFSGAYSPTRAYDRGHTSERVNTNLRLEGAYSFRLASATRAPVSGQIFVRFARLSFRNFDRTFDLDAENRSWTVNTGVTLSIF